MAKIRITTAVLEKASYAKGDRFIWDAMENGFGARVNRNGTISFIVQARSGGRGTPVKRLTIGTFGRMKVDEARSEARKALGRIHLSPQNPAPKAPIFKDASETFISTHIQTNWKRRGEDAARDVRNVLQPHFEGKRVDAITKADIHSLLDSYNDRQGRRKALHSLVRLFFNWCVGRGFVTASPLAGTKAPAPCSARTRFLSPREVWAVWHACTQVNYPFGPLIRLLLLTGQRRGQIATLRWEQVRGLNSDHPDIVFHSTQMKMQHECLVPLSPWAVRVLEVLSPAQKGLVFTTNGKTPVSGFSDGKERVDKLATEYLQIATSAAQVDSSAMLPAWKLHDLRRTMASALQAAGFPIEVTEAVLDHHSGRVSGITAVYHLHGYEEEKRDALNQWARMISFVAKASDPLQLPTGWRSLVRSMKAEASVHTSPSAALTDSRQYGLFSFEEESMAAASR